MAAAAAASIGAKHHARWTGTGLRVSSPEASVEFYRKHFGMVEAGSIAFGPSVIRTLFRPQSKLFTPGAAGVEAYLEKHPVNFLSLVFDPSVAGQPKMNNGNEEPHRGFGHIAFNVNDVREFCKHLEAGGVRFQKKPDEGRMKNIAFALDPDGYWIEIVGRSTPSADDACNLSQTMMRVKDPAKAIRFYNEVCGMALVYNMRASDFANHFMSSDPPAGAVNPDDRDSWLRVKDGWSPVLELTHNYGTEKDASFSYHTGNTPPLGFAGIEITVDDVDAFLKDATPERLADYGASVAPPRPDGLRGLLDCDGYFVLLTGRSDFAPRDADPDFSAVAPADGDVARKAHK